MQPDSRKEERPAEPRKEVTERKRRFQIVKLEERIAPSLGNRTYKHLCHGTSYSPGHCR